MGDLVIFIGLLTRCPFYGDLGGPQGWSGWMWKISPPSGIQYVILDFDILILNPQMLLLKWQWCVLVNVYSQNLKEVYELLI